MDNFYLILAYLLIGVLLRRLPALPDNSGLVLNIYVLYVALPALVLKSVPLLHFTSALIIPALTPWLLLLVVVILVLTLSRLFNWSREVTGALLIILPLGNTSFLGYPMTEALFGLQAMPYAVVYDQLGSFIALSTYVTLVAAMFSPQIAKPTAKGIFLKILTFPSFVALAAGLMLREVEQPALAVKLIDSLAATLVPVVMVAVGFQLKFKLDRAELNPLISALLIKLAAMPAITWFIWYSVGQQGLSVTISIFQAAMPPMISAGAIAIMAGLAPRLVSGIVGFGILLSLITLPLIHWLLT